MLTRITIFQTKDKLFMHAIAAPQAQQFPPIVVKALSEWKRWGETEKGTMKRRIFDSGQSLVDKIDPHEVSMF